MNSQLKIKFLKIAKQMDISMTRPCEEIRERSGHGTIKRRSNRFK